jgi:SAM-dependent methyltransferase
MQKKADTSWENVEHWYSSCVGEKGHYYHQSLILPGALRLLGISEKSRLSILDLGCGQGVLARALPNQMTYYGIDASSSLINQAKKLSKHPNTHFFNADATQQLPIEKKDFDCACFVLSLQNIEHPQQAIQQARLHLRKEGRLLIVLNHPCFRIPRQSSWQIDEASKIQYRRINRYKSAMKIPIQMHPGKNTCESTTFSFHHPLCDYVKYLTENQFAIIGLEEWCSDKRSEGTKAKMEDRAREEIPLFLALVARAE